MARRRQELEHIRKIFGLANDKCLAITLPKFLTKELDWLKGDELELFIIKGGDIINNGDVIIRRHNQ